MLKSRYIERELLERSHVGRCAYSTRQLTPNEIFCLYVLYKYYLNDELSECLGDGWPIRRARNSGHYILLEEDIDGYDIYVYLKVKKRIPYPEKKYLEIYDTLGKVPDINRLLAYFNNVDANVNIVTITRQLYLIYWDKTFLFTFRRGNEWYYLMINIFKGKDFLDYENINEFVEGFFLVDWRRGTVYDYIDQSIYIPQRGWKMIKEKMEYSQNSYMENTEKRHELLN